MLNEYLDLDKFPLNKPESDGYSRLVEQCKGELATEGMFNLEQFVRPACLAKSVEDILPSMASPRRNTINSSNTEKAKRKPQRLKNSRKGSSTYLASPVTAWWRR